MPAGLAYVRAVNFDWVPTMKPNSAIQNTLVITFAAVVIIALSAFATGYTGDVRFNIGPNGIQFEMDSN